MKSKMAQVVSFVGHRDQLLERLALFFRQTDEDERRYYVYHTDSPIVFLWTRRPLPGEVLSALKIAHNEVVVLRKNKGPSLGVIRGGKA